MTPTIKLAALLAVFSSQSACVAVPGVLIAASVASPGPALSFYPVSGSLSDRAPRPVLRGNAGGLLTSRTVAVTTDTRSNCSGQWHLVDNASSNGATTPASLEQDWDAVYGKNHFQSAVLGEPRHASAVLRCTDGTVITAEFNATREQPEKAYGVAEDSHGNVFKIVYN